MDLSVIIVSWNTKSLLLGCLRSLQESLGDSPWRTEVFVVDNASADGSSDAVQELFPGVRLLQNDTNQGFARANNRALSAAQGRYCLLLNSDTLLPQGALSELIGVMEESQGFAVCSPLLVNTDGSPQFCWARFPGARSELFGILDRSQSPYPLSTFADATKRAAMQPFPVDWVGGACFLVRRQAIQAVGLLEEGFFMYSEETEWCHRFARHGWQTLLVPTATVTHLGGRSSQRVPLATRKHMFRSSLRLYRLLYGRLGAVLPSAIAIIRYGLFHVRYLLRRYNPRDPVQ